MSKSQWLPDDKQTGNFSNDKQDTFDPGKGYVGIRLQQGVPLLDRDWNELEDIRRYAEVMLRRHYVGNGTPDDGFRISALDEPGNDFKISIGRCLVDGFEVVNDSDITYSQHAEQHDDVPSLTVPDSPRTDIVYLDVWIEEITEEEDEDLKNSQDVNVETCVRHKLEMRIRVDEGNTGNPGEEKHYYYNVAQINRIANTAEITVDMIEDLRRTDLAVYHLKDIIDSLTINVLEHNHSKLVSPGGAPDPALSVNNNGYVGIGTSDPKEKLSIYDGELVLQTDNNTEEQGILYQNLGGFYTWRIYRADAGGSQAHLRIAGGFNTNYTMLDDRLVIDKDGNVGIGTNDPGAHLEITNGHGDWIFLRQERLEENDAGGFFIHNAWREDDGENRNRLQIGYRTHSNVHLWQHFVIHGPTGNIGIGTAEPGDDKLDVRGHIHAEGGCDSTNMDFAEYFESENSIAIPVSTSVILTKKGKIRKAKEGEVPIGIISARSAFLGNSYKEWPKKYLKDEFGNQIMEDYKEEIIIPKKEKIKKERQKTKKKKIKEKVKHTEIVQKKGKYCQVEIEETIEHEEEEPLFKEVDLYDASGKKKIGKHQVPVMETYEEEIDVKDENGQPVMVGSGKFETISRPKINPEYDETKEYIPREKRPEWNCVGLLGQLPLRKGQPVAPTWVKIKDISKDVELWLVK